MMQAGSLMVWEDLRHSTIDPSLRDGINQLAGISEEVKKVIGILFHRTASSITLIVML